MRDVYVPDKNSFENQVHSLMAVQDRLSSVVADLRELVTTARAATEAVERIVNNAWVRIGIMATVVAVPVAIAAVIVAFMRKVTP